MNINVILLFLFTFSRITKSDFEFHSVLVQPGEDVTLLCSNRSRKVEFLFWYKLVDGSTVSRISSMVDVGSEAYLSDGFQREKFIMTSNVTNIFLDIKQVNFSDSGVYICGTMTPGCHKIFSETYLQVEVVDGLDGVNLPTVILGGVVVFLVIIILGLLLKTKPSHAGQTNRQNQQPNENLDSDLVNYAALNFRPKANRTRRPPAERETDANVVYAATR